MNKKLKEYLIITLGFIIVALGLTVFLIPSNLAVGGVTGLSLIIHTHFNFLSVGFLLILINSILFIIAFFTLGPAFGAKSIYASLGLSGAIWFIQRLFPGMKPLTDDLFINLVFGMLVSSTGMSLVLYQNASTGGTDILAKILNKFLHIPIGRSLLFVDFFITILAGLTFGPRLGLYALLGVIMNGMIIDNMIAGLGTKINVHIVCTNPEVIRDFITRNLLRGATLYKAEGAYTKEAKTVIVAVMSKREFIRLKKHVELNEPSAFVTANVVHTVMGQGFLSN